jgi:hypothetical protein
MLRKFDAAVNRTIDVWTQVGWNVVLCKIATSAPTQGQAREARSRSRELAGIEDDVESGNAREVLKQS